VSVPHVNELQSKLGTRGLTVVGVTGEPKGLTEKWIKEKGATYGYSYDKGNAFHTASKAGGWPHAILVNPAGKIVWTGHPGNLQETQVEEALTGALTKPLWELPKEFLKARAAISKDQLTAALKEIDAVAGTASVSAEAATLRAAVSAMIDGRLAGGQAAAVAGDWSGAKTIYDQLAKATPGLPAEKTAKDALAEIAKNADAQKAIKADKALEPVMAMPDKKPKDKEAKVAALRDFVKHNAGLFAAKRAEEAVTALTATKG
jgi:hypothetical protein